MLTSDVEIGVSVRFLPAYASHYEEGKSSTWIIERVNVKARVPTEPIAQMETYGKVVQIRNMDTGVWAFAPVAWLMTSPDFSSSDAIALSSRLSKVEAERDRLLDACREKNGAISALALELERERQHSHAMVTDASKDGGMVLLPSEVRVLAVIISGLHDHVVDVEVEVVEADRVIRVSDEIRTDGGRDLLLAKAAVLGLVKRSPRCWDS